MFWKLFDACCEYSIAAPPMLWARYRPAKTASSQRDLFNTVIIASLRVPHLAEWITPNGILSKTHSQDEKMIPVIPGCIFKSSWSELSDNHLEWDQWSWHHIDIENIPELSKMVLILCMLIFIFSCDRVLPIHSFAFGMCQRYVNPLPGTCCRNVSSVDEDRTIGLFHKPSSKQQKGSSSYHSLQSDVAPFSKAMTGFLRRPSPNSVCLIWCNGWNSNVKPGAKSKSLLNLGPLFSKTKIRGNIHCQMFRHWNNGTLKGAGHPNLLMNLHQAQRRLIQVMLVCQNQNRSNRSNDLDPVGAAGIQPEAAKKTNTFFWHHVCETYILYQFWQYFFKDGKPNTPCDIHCVTSRFQLCHTHPTSEILGWNLHSTLDFFALLLLWILWLRGLVKNEHQRFVVDPISILHLVVRKLQLDLS